MPVYAPPVRDIRFLLHELLDLQAHSSVAGFADLTPDLIDAVIEEGGRFATEVAAPLNASGDAEGCRWRGGEVVTPAGFREAYRAYVDAGWPGLHAPREYGGQGLPGVVALPVTEMLTSANWGFSSYPGLTAHAIGPVAHFADVAVRSQYLPKMVSGEWAATMDLTEPQCGSDLGLLRTRATATGDGSYRIKGTKIFITAGEHDLTENIVHLVLARIENAPAGVRGISLFVVPKFLPDASGSPATRNGVRCARIEEKMGIHASATCELVYDDAVGWLVGEPHRGLAAMFTMMNTARIGAGMQGVAIAEVAYQNAVAYARSRLQGRAASSAANPTGPADPIISHPDVRRMLLGIRSICEGGRALVYWSALLSDLAAAHPDAAQRQHAAALLEVLTPVVKSYLTDQGVEATSLAMQCLGGHGYIREWGIEQFMRDARIAPLYEGTNGIQAMDLVGRKLLAGGGRSLESLFQVVDAFLLEAGADPALATPLEQMDGLLRTAREASSLLQRSAPSDPDLPGAVAHHYLNLIALLTLGYLWLRMWRSALRHLAGPGAEHDFYQAKIATARFFFASSAPLADLHHARIVAGSGPVMSLENDAF